jgi:hypothetical protein
MEDRDPIFIVYPETYVLYAEAWKDKRFDGDLPPLTESRC